MEQIAALRDGRIDAGFVRMPLEHRGVECELIARDAFVVALPAAHPMASRRRVELARLASDPFVMLEASQHPRFHATTLDVCRRAGFAPHVVQESDRLQNLVVMVAGGMGVALLPDTMTAFRSPGVVFRRLAGEAGEAILETGIIYRRGIRPPMVDAFLASVRSYVAQRAKAKRR